MTPALTATLARLRELEKKASDKPWSNIPGEQGLGIFDNRYCLVAESMSRIDLNLIIQSRNALPALLDALEARERAFEIAMDALNESHYEDRRRGIDLDRTGLALYRANALAKINEILEQRTVASSDAERSDAL